MNVFNVIYALRDSQLISIENSRESYYVGDVYTFRVMGIKYSCLGRRVISLDILIIEHGPILIIKMED